MPNNIGASEVLKMKDKYYLTVNGQDVFLKKLAVSKGSLKKNKKCVKYPEIFQSKWQKKGKNMCAAQKTSFLAQPPPLWKVSTFL